MPASGAALTLGRHLPALAKSGLVARDLTAPFSNTVNKVVTNPWLKKLLDLECFVLRCCHLHCSFLLLLQLGTMGPDAARKFVQGVHQNLDRQLQNGVIYNVLPALVHASSAASLVVIPYDSYEAVA